MVRACHTPQQPLKNHSSEHLGVWATPWSAEKRLDGQHQRVDIPGHARTAPKGLLQKRLEEDLCWIVPHDPPDDPIGQGTELTWNELFRRWHPKLGEGPDPSSSTVVWLCNKAFSCYGTRQTLTSPSDRVLCPMNTAQTTFLSKISHCLKVISNSVFRTTLPDILIVDRGLETVCNVWNLCGWSQQDTPRRFMMMYHQS